MKLNQDTKNALSAEYVLGTLRGKARQRFQTLVMQSQALREQTWLWEQHLNEMAEQLAPVAPPKHVWRRIQSQLGLTDEVTEVVPLKPIPGSKIWPMLASAALLLLAVLAVRYDPEVPQPQYQQIAIFNNAEAEPVWLLEISETEIIVRATASLQQRAENDYQLWIVVQDGRAPISLGLLPQGGRISLDKLPIYDQISIAALAVSLEPLGGSPNGLPTEVLYTTQPVTL